MGDSSYHQLSEFNIQGEFLGFVGDGVGKQKYLRLAIENQEAIASFAAGELLIKISQELRPSLALTLVPGAQIQVSGVRKFNQYTGKLKLKADRITPVTASLEPTMSAVQALPFQPKAKILICQKSGCVKRGGKGLYQVLEGAIRERGLQERVTIERTNCLKCCSSGPNLVFIFGKAYYSRVHPDAIPALLEKHLSNPSQN